MLPRGRPAAPGIDPRPASRATQQAGLARHTAAGHLSPGYQGEAKVHETPSGRGWACVWRRWRRPLRDKEPRGTHTPGGASPEAPLRGRRAFQDKYFIHHGLDATLVGLVTLSSITVNTPLIHWFYVF